MHLPLINTFIPPYEVWLKRETTLEERLDFIKNNQPLLFQIKEKLIRSIDNHFEAAEHILNMRVDNALENHINDCLHSSSECQMWKMSMPKETPKALYDYKNSYPNYDKQKVDEAINALGFCVSEGQKLFHGGLFNDAREYLTDRPLSASFCPQVALRNAEWRGKAFDRGQIDIFVLKATSPSTHAFFYNLDEQLGNEKEVLFASGAKLKMISRTKILDNYRVIKINSNCKEFEKNVPVYVVEIEIS